MENVKRFAHRAACELRDVRAARAGISATEFLARREATPARFDTVAMGEKWVRQQVKRRRSERVRFAP